MLMLFKCAINSCHIEHVTLNDRQSWMFDIHVRRVSRESRYVETTQKCLRDQAPAARPGCAKNDDTLTQPSHHLILRSGHRVRNSNDQKIDADHD